ncbi:MAG: alpha/beta hydrolase [Moraxellaceae bacterium]|jgi:pimeloyl-ACP methyl ester carboxylesterase|nr:alpha/beta hydrolase [Moraxellaceae bacterium]
MAAVEIPVSLREWQAAGSFADYRGHRIFLRRGGPADAPVLLLIHGFPSASWDWEALWPALTERWRVLAPDLIGFGFSDKPAHYDYSIIDQAELCESLLRVEGVSTYHVLAHDYGDTVAQELLARQAPAAGAPRLQSVALLNGGLFPEVHRPLLTQKLLASAAGPLLARLMSRRTFAASMTRIFGAHTPPSAELLDGFWRLLEVNKGRQVLPRLIRYMEERRQHRERWVGALVNSTIPLKLINGEADPISGGHMVARYRELVPAPDVTVLAGIGHYPQCEAPDAVLRAYFLFRNTD